MANNKISPLAAASSEVPDTYYPPEDIQRELQVLLNRPQEPRQADFFGRSAPQGIQRRGEPVVNPFRFLQEAGRGALGMEPQMQRGSAAYRAGQALSAGPGAAATLPGKLAGSGADVLAGLGAAAGVIKPKGGNWPAGAFSAERALKPLKKSVDPELAGYAERGQNLMPHEAADVLPKMALNKWIDTKLTKYVKNEMATPEDPVRALAERGTLHFEPQDVPSPTGFERESRTLRENRKAGGYPIEGLGKSNLARDWESLADINIMHNRAGLFRLIKSELERNPWLEKVSPDTLVYSMNLDTYMSKLGFDHIIDELSNAMNPNSGLPASLRIQPKDLEKITVPQAVERVAKINEWRAAQKAEADALKARNPATFEYRAYETVPGTAEPNQKGMRWVELRRPEPKTPEDFSTWSKQEQENYLSLPDSASRKQLEEALKYEGDVMGHCVGGYCPDVLAGRSRIYSLRDKKGEPHVTIEVEPDMRAGFREGEGPRTPEEDVDLRNLYINQVRTNRVPQDVTFAQWWRARNNIPEPEQMMQISQIKGKGNKAPKEEYLPFVQDFVRSGNWSRVGDLQNTGLLTLRPEYNKDLIDAIIKSGGTAPSYVTKEELADLVKTYLPDENYARGGAVKSSLDMAGMNLFDILRTV